MRWNPALAPGCPHAVGIAGRKSRPGRMMPFRPMARGGPTLNGPRDIRWTVVAPRPHGIERAGKESHAARWGRGQFDLPGGDRDGLIPLPD